MLFSEPKIPQSRSRRTIHLRLPQFQCSSASRKFLNPRCGNHTPHREESFSALQRAENSSIQLHADQRAVAEQTRFQCSSASRKFLNPCAVYDRCQRQRAFQCSSASRKFLNPRRPAASARAGTVSVLFSEPKIPQSHANRPVSAPAILVSVLFSEPKIPQSQRAGEYSVRVIEFQCSSASRKFLNPKRTAGCAQSARRFQCSSASRKFLNRTTPRLGVRWSPRVSVLFSEPKIPQSAAAAPAPRGGRGFSALQRAENSSIRSIVGEDVERDRFQCSSASRKFLNTRAVSVPNAEPRVSVLFSEPKIPQSRVDDARGL